MKRVLVTGASGFIGRHCLRMLLNGGSGQVHALSRRDPDLSLARGATWHTVDVRDQQRMASFVRELRPTHLLHCAWVATPGVYIRSPENLDWLNATLSLARAFGEAGGKRFVGVGSSAEYAPADGPCQEDATPIAPATIYGKCKAACWQAVQAAGQHHGYATAWGRVFLPYGPGDTAQRLIPSLITALRASKPIETTQGHQLRDFIFATDAAALLVRILEGTETGAFNIGTGRGTPVRRAIELLADRLGASRELLRFGARPLAEGEPMVLVADMEKVRRSLGWTPTVSVEEGLALTVAQSVT